MDGLDRVAVTGSDGIKAADPGGDLDLGSHTVRNAVGSRHHPSGRHEGSAAVLGREAVGDTRREDRDRVGVVGDR